MGPALGDVRPLAAPRGIGPTCEARSLAGFPGKPAPARGTAEEPAMWLLVWMLDVAAIAVLASRYVRARHTAAGHRHH